MRITRHRRVPDPPPSADLRLDDDFLDLPLAPSAGLAAEPPPARRRRRWPWLAVLALAAAASGAAGYYLNLSPPWLALSAERLDFGDVRLGTAARDLAVEIANRGEKVLEVATVALAGEASAEFTLAADGCSGRQVAPGQTCTVRVAFSPLSTDVRPARLDVTTNAVNPLERLPLMGRGVAPELAAAPPRLDFGDEVLGAASPAARLWLSNPGSAALRIERVELSGLAAADFITLRDACSGRSVEPGERCAVDYRFVPTREGLRRALVSITSDAAALADAPWLVGVGRPREPLLRLVPERVDFGALLVGAASPVQTVTVHNDGDGPLAVRRVLPSVGEAVPPGGEPPPRPAPGDPLSPDNDLPPQQDAREVGFDLVKDGCSGRTVPPGGTCAVELRFRPRREGEAHGFFEIAHSAREGSHALAVTGTGTAPEASVDPRRLAFEGVPVATWSRPRTVRLINSGSGPLDVKSVAVEGGDRQSFSPPASGCAGATLAPGASCAVEVRFRPRRDGPHRAELVLRHSARGGVHRVPLNGLGVSAVLAAEPAQLDFGRVRPARGRRELRLENRGRAPVAIRRLSLDGAWAGAFALIDDGCSGVRLAPGRSCTASVVLAAGRAGSHSATLRIDHGAAGVREVAVTATALPPD